MQMPGEPLYNRTLVCSNAINNRTICICERNFNYTKDRVWIVVPAFVRPRSRRRVSIVRNRARFRDRTNVQRNCGKEIARRSDFPGERRLNRNRRWNSFADRMMCNTIAISTVIFYRLERRRRSRVPFINDDPARYGG